LTKLDNQFSRETVEFLEIRELINRIEPSSFYGKSYFKNPTVFVHGDESDLKSHFDKLKILSDFMLAHDSDKLKRSLRELKNIRTSIKKIAGDELPNVVDYFEIKRFCYFYRRLYDLLNNSEMGKGLVELYAFKEIEEIWHLLDPKDTRQFFFSIDSDYADELGSELEKYRSLDKEVFLKISERLQKLYELPVSNRTEFVLQRSDLRNQGLRNCDNVLVQGETAFSISYRIVRSDRDPSYAAEIERIEVELAKEDIRYRTRLKQWLSIHLDTFSRIIEIVTEFDKDVAMAEFGIRYKCCYPEICEGEIQLSLLNGRNTEIEEFCCKNGFEYDQINIDLKSGSTIITGANMGGKTSALKTIGQIYVQCAIGLPITADCLTTSLFNGINCVYRTSEEEGLSGFAMEVMRIRTIFSDELTINLIDEFGSATNPREGSALASAAVNIMDDKKAISIFVTHFSSPLEFGSVNYQTGFLKSDFSDAINAENIYRYIDHHLEKIEKTEIPKAAIQISRALGLPSEVVTAAEGIYEDYYRET